MIKYEKRKIEDSEIRKIRNSNFSTKRVTVGENILYKPHKALDHGFVRAIDYMGDDSSIVQACIYESGTKN